MHKIEKIGENCFYIKTLGTFPPSAAKKFIEDFNEISKDLDHFSVIIDNLDAILLHVESFNIMLEILKKNNEKLLRSAFIISKNPPLASEVRLLLEKAHNPKRKIVENLDDAKEWVGLKDIIFQK